MRSRLIPRFVVGGLLLAGAIWGATSIALSSAVAADHDGPDTHLIPRTVSGEQIFPIMRNVARGDPVPVCSEDYPEATQAAIAWWNDGVGIDMFEWAPAAPGRDWKTNCPVNDEDQDRYLGVGGILVYNWGNRGGALPDCWTPPGDLPPLGCWSMEESDPDDHVDVDWNTWFGRMLIRMNPSDFPRDWNPADPTFAGPSATSMCHSSATLSTDPDGYECYRLVSILAHELGHALSFVDRYTLVRNAAGDVVDITCVDGGVDIVSIMCNFDHRRALDYDGLKDEDKAHYRAVYVPGSVVGVTASNITSEGFEISWDAEDVHVERGVAVLWRPREGSTNMADLQACRDPVGVWYRARLVGTPLLVSPLSSTSEGYDGRTGSLALDFGTTGVDREYVVVANTAGVAANAAAPALEAWRDVDVDGMVDDDTIQLCSHDPPLGTPGQRLGVDGYAYAYGPYSLAGTLVGDDSFVSVRTRPIVAVSAGRSTVTEGDGAAFTLTRVAATDAGPSTAALTVRL